MKALKLGLAIAAAAMMVIGFSGIADAFHSGGVAECTGCHTMHSQPAAGSFLLKGTDQSSTCLNCHQETADTGPSSYHISTAPTHLGAGLSPLERTPGGDFAWLKKDYAMTIRGTTTTERGETHGHNIIAVDYGYVADSTNATAPGGTFNANNLACNSCHDPHGKYRRLSDGTIATTGAPIIGSGSYQNSVDPAAGQAVGVYRLLGGVGFANSRTAGVTFTVNPPVAVTNATYNRTESATQTRTAYGKGMSEWCATCHSGMHSSTAATFVHPVSQAIGSDISNNYNSYVGSGNMTGTSATSYLSLVPYEEGASATIANLKALAATSGTATIAGPSSSAQVACISCHRAHASGFPEMTRWNNDGEFITYTGLWPGTDSTPTVPQFARGRVAAEMAAAYYDRPATVFATYQRSLCNKCHAKD